MNDNKNEKQESEYESLISSNFKQQKVASWRPIPTLVSTSLPLFVFGLIFIILGAIIYTFSTKITTINAVNASSLDYTNCVKDTSGICDVIFTLNETLTSPIYFYYNLTNFYQNHRKYINSKSENQLSGIIETANDVKGDCYPLITNSDMNLTTSINGNPLNPNDVAYPCGLMAYSFFNDTFSIYDSNNIQIPINETNIAWTSDKDLLYKMPDNTTTFNAQDSLWIDITNEHFIVWMRPSAYSYARKLWGRIEKDLPAGTYKIKVNNNYKINFGGKKQIILSTSNKFGGKQTFLGLAYLAVGSVFIIISGIFVFAYRRNDKVKVS